MPMLALAEGMPRDLRELARETWGHYLEAFPARRDCLVPVTVEGVYRLDDRATYDPRRRLIKLRIPWTAPNLQASLVHELGHHLEFTCPQQRGLREEFLAAQGFPRDAPWFGGATWERRPSEHFAEATAQYVLGRSPGRARITATPEAVRVIRVWATSR